MSENPAPETSLSRVARHAAKKLAFPPGLPAGEVLPKARDFLRLENELMERHHRAGVSGLKLARERSDVLDALLTALWSQASAEFTIAEGAETGEACPLALLAVGGYGRREMCPHSDVDLLFLAPDRLGKSRLKTAQKTLVDRILYILWDLRLRVGYSFRDISANLAEAEANVQSKNALLESRLLAGSEALYQKFLRSFRAHCQKGALIPYLRDRLADQEKRRAHYGGTVFLQEPDIKNGVGGLRDYQNIRWIIRLKLSTEDPDEALARNYLNKNEHRDFISSYDFLLRVRHELHFQNQRPTDILNLEKQPSVAWSLGYRQTDIFRRVESFMKDYYRCAQTIYQTSRHLEKRLAKAEKQSGTLRAVFESRRRRHRQEVDGFCIYKGVLNASHDRVFQEDPERLVRVFRHAQQYGAEIDFELNRLIFENLPLLDARVINSPAANRALRSILQEAGAVYPILLQMLELGVLPRMVPEFAGLVCLVQHEFYHRYTADFHTLNTIHELDGIFNGDEPALTAKYKDELHATEIPALLYLVLLLHDLGKGKGAENHPIRGAEMAAPILKRMGIHRELHEKIVFLIAHHLDMSQWWQRFDIEDPGTIQAFAELIRDADVLRYLYVLNFCDARGTSRELWNSYKDTLHRELFSATLRKLGAGSERHPARVMTSLAELRKQLPEVPAEEIEAHYNLLPERYFIYNSTEEIALHLRMVNVLLKRIAVADSVACLIPVVEWQDDMSLDLTVVHIVTWDRAGLFFKLAGAFSVAGLSIVSSKALTRADHITIDTFYVREPNGGVVRTKHIRELFSQQLAEALQHNKDLLPEIQLRAKQLRRPSYLEKTSQLRAPIPPSVDIYHELSLKRTIIEVRANDSIGLLYRLTRAIFELGFDITFARIATERQVAVDTFYIEPVDKTKPSETASLLALREALQRIIEPPGEAAVNQ